MNYFVKTKILNSKAFGLFKHGHVPIIEAATSENGDVIRCECLPEMKTNLKYNFNVTKLVRSLMSATVHAQQQGKDHSPPTNTYLLYALPLKSL